MANILVTCAGSGVGQSVIDSLLLSGNHIITGCDTNRNVYAHHYCHHFFEVPNIYKDNYLDTILDLCLRENICLIIPGHDHELLLFSKNISTFHSNGIEVIVSNPDLIEISRDKYLWYDYFKKYNCSVVPTFKINMFKNREDNSILPAIIKPAGGSASQGIKIINSLSEIEYNNDTDIIQPYLFPTTADPNYSTIIENVKKGKFVQMSEISIQLIFTKNSEFSGIFISNNILKGGVPVHVDPIQPEEFEYLDDIMKFVPVCIDNDVKGPVNIQGRITNKGLVCFEMNMRFTGITGNRAHLGFNEVDFLVSNFLNEPTEPLKGYSGNKYGVRQVACTTIEKEVDKRKKTHNFSILVGDDDSQVKTLNHIVDSFSYNKLFVLCPDASYEKCCQSFSTLENVHVCKESDVFRASAFAQSDVLINLNNRSLKNDTNEILTNILYNYQQINIVNQSKVPFIIDVHYSPKNIDENFQDNIADNAYNESILSISSFQKSFHGLLLDSIQKHSPATKIFKIELPFEETEKSFTETEINNFLETLAELVSNF